MTLISLILSHALRSPRQTSFAGKTFPSLRRNQYKANNTKKQRRVKIILQLKLKSRGIHTSEKKTRKKETKCSSCCWFVPSSVWHLLREATTQGTPDRLLAQDTKRMETMQPRRLRTSLRQRKEAYHNRPHSSPTIGSMEIQALDISNNLSASVSSSQSSPSNSNKLSLSHRLDISVAVVVKLSTHVVKYWLASESQRISSSSFIRSALIS